LSLGILVVVIAVLKWIGSNDSDAIETTLRCRDCAETSVTLVIDGDTLETGQGRVRLFGVGAPESGERCAAEATARLNDLAGDSVRLQNGPRLFDRFGRILAYVYTEDGFSIDEVLVREGLAEAWTSDGQYRSLLVASESDARRDNTGCLSDDSNATG
tara:strand:- start:203 stop:676 length:474 start_codon:yes stop_codon:yes gene_type:complete